MEGRERWKMMKENTTRRPRHAPLLLFSQSCNIHVAKDGSGDVHERERVRRGEKEGNPNNLLIEQTNSPESDSSFTH